VTLTSSTLSANQASQGGGGAIDNYGGANTVTVGNSIIAGNSCPYGPDFSNGVVSLGSNLVGQTDGSSGWVGSDLTGTSAAPLDPVLAPLGNYGGPTQTMALLAGSPALNAGDPSQLGTADQRGVVRSGGVNIGAYQASASAFVVTAPATVTAGTPFDFTVTAVDMFGQTALGYTGTVVFSTMDPAGTFNPTGYTFQASDMGTALFPLGATLNTAGSTWDVTATDTTSGITGSASVAVSAGLAPSPRPGGRGGSAAVPVQAADPSTVNALDALFASRDQPWRDSWAWAQSRTASGRHPTWYEFE
jgi:hypothetical protein